MIVGPPHWSSRNGYWRKATRFASSRTAGCPACDPLDGAPVPTESTSSGGEAIRYSSGSTSHFEAVLRAHVPVARELQQLVGERALPRDHAAALPDQRGNTRCASCDRAASRAALIAAMRASPRSGAPTAVAICRICCSLSATLSATENFTIRNACAPARRSSRANMRPGHHQVRRERHHFFGRAGGHTEASRQLERNRRRCGILRVVADAENLLGHRRRARAQHRRRD